MNEKTIIVSQKNKAAINSILIIGLLFLIAGIIFIGIAVALDIEADKLWESWGYRGKNQHYWYNEAWSWFGFAFVGAAMPVLLYYMAVCSFEIVVTNSRVFGKRFFGTQIDIPLDSISAVYISNLCSKIVVASSSGRIGFSYIKNRADIHREISALLRDRQPVAGNNLQHEEDEFEKLKKYKELLDTEVITQEEFEAKKKQLLDL